MRIRALVFSFGIVATCLYADEVTLKNGDKLTGTISKKENKNLSIKSASLGSVTVPWADVQAISTESPVTIVLSGDRTLVGTVRSADGRVVVRGADGEQQVALEDLVALRSSAEQTAYERLLQPRLLDLWAGGATFGLAGTQGNAETRTLTAALAAARITRTDKTSIYFNAIRASAFLGTQSATTAQAVRGGIGYAHNVARRVFFNAFNDYEYDRFQSLNLRFVLGGGLGYIAWEGERGRFDVLGGLAYNRETFGPPAPSASFTRNSAEAYVGDDFAYKLNAVTALYQNLRFFPNLTDTGSYRANFDLGANTRLVRWLSWNVAISDRYLSNPVPGRKKNDFLYTTGVGIIFSR